MMYGFFRIRKAALAFSYTFHVSYCGSLDTMELVAYDAEHDLYHATTVRWEEADQADNFGEVYGKAIGSLFDAIQEHEAYYLRAQT